MHKLHYFVRTVTANRQSAWSKFRARVQGRLELGVCSTRRSSDLLVLVTQAVVGGGVVVDLSYASCSPSPVILLKEFHSEPLDGCSRLRVAAVFLATVGCHVEIQSE